MQLGPQRDAVNGGAAARAARAAQALGTALDGLVVGGEEARDKQVSFSSGRQSEARGRGTRALRALPRARSAHTSCLGARADPTVSRMVLMCGATRGTGLTLQDIIAARLARRLPYVYTPGAAHLSGSALSACSYTFYHLRGPARRDATTATERRGEPSRTRAAEPERSPAAPGRAETRADGSPCASGAPALRERRRPRLAPGAPRGQPDTRGRVRAERTSRVGRRASRRPRPVFLFGPRARADATRRRPPARARPATAAGGTEPRDRNTIHT